MIGTDSPQHNQNTTISSSLNNKSKNTTSASLLMLSMLWALTTALLALGTTVAYGEDSTNNDGGGGVVPLIGAEISSQKTSAVESNIFQVTPGIIFQTNDLTGVGLLTLAYSANSLNVTSIPALAGIEIADTTEYQFEGHLYYPRYTFTAIAQGTSFDNKVSTESYLDAAYIDFSRVYQPYEHVAFNLGAGVLYTREGPILIPFPVISANITTERLEANIGLPTTSVIYTLDPEKQYLSLEVATLGAGGTAAVSWDYLPTPDTDLTLSYVLDDRGEAYGFLNNNTEIDRTTHSVASKIQYKYFYAESAFHFISKLHSYDLEKGEKTNLVNYREKPYAAFTIGAISYTQ